MYQDLDAARFAKSTGIPMGRPLMRKRLVQIESKIPQLRY